MSGGVRGPLDYDFETRRVALDGVEIVYVDEGSRDGSLPLLLVHGLGATLDHWALSIPFLSARHRVIALDLPGFGRSGKPDRGYGPQAFVESIASFLDALGLTRVHLVGHSMGGAICAEFALLHPDRVSSLVLVDAAGMTRMPTRLLDFLVARFERRVDPGRVQLPPRLVRALVKLVFYEPIPFSERNVDRILASAGEEDWPERVRGFVRSITGLSRSQVRARLGEVSTPTWIVWGENDRIIPLRHGKALEKGIPNSRLTVFPRTGHCPMLETPERFCEGMETFLAEAVEGRVTHGGGSGDGSGKAGAA